MQLMRYAQIDANGVVFAWLDTHAPIVQADMIATDLGPGETLGRKWDGVEFRVRAKAAKEAALEQLAVIDAQAGMGRMLRESLIAIAGAKAPASLVAAEAAAAAERAKLALPE